MLPTRDIKEQTAKIKKTPKFDNLSTALKKNLQRRKKVKKEKNVTIRQSLTKLQAMVKDYTDSTGEKISLVDELIKSRRLESDNE